MQNYQSEQDFIFTVPESILSPFLADFVFDEFENSQILNKVNEIKCENAFDQQMYPFGDWRDLCDLRSKSWNYNSVSIKSECTNLKSIDCEKNPELSYKRVFNIEKIRKSEIIQSNLCYSLDTVKIKKSNVSSNIAVSNIFNSKNCKQNKCERRDVINKSILRYFHKFMKDLFGKIFENSLSIQRQTYRKGNKVELLSSFLMNLNLIKCCKPNEQKEMKLNNSMIEYAEWLARGGKITASRSSSSQSISSKFSSNSNSFYSSVKKLNELNSPVKIMNELLHRYSHYKLQKFFEDETLRIFFTYFIKMEKENFISEFNESKRSKLVEAIEDFERNIQSFQ